jgi:hypothetical protein
MDWIFPSIPFIPSMPLITPTMMSGSSIWLCPPLPLSRSNSLAAPSSTIFEKMEKKHYYLLSLSPIDLHLQFGHIPNSGPIFWQICPICLLLLFTAASTCTSTTLSVFLQFRAIGKNNN